MAQLNQVAIDIHDLEFSYPGQTSPCFRNINLQIHAGERFGLFGPNGAGKTTLMNCLTGLLSFKKGSVQLFGNAIGNHTHAVKKLFGLVPQEFSFYQELSPVENLAFFGAWSGLNKQQIKIKTKELMEVLGLSEVQNKAVHTFSGGMKRRVNLAIGVIHNPPLLILDEPTVGVDVHTRHAIIQYLKDLNAKGTTLIYTSHQLSEAEDLCDKIALLDEGKILVHEHLDKLLAAHGDEGLEGLFIRLTGKKYRDT